MTKNKIKNYTISNKVIVEINESKSLSYGSCTAATPQTLSSE